jgi:DNA-binding transcriptional ArsR family regulator
MQSAAVVEDKIFQALADPSRRAIFESLTRGEAAVKDLTARFDISQPAVSQHLATLKDAGLVNGRREGRCVYYRVEPRGMKPLIDWIAHYRAFWTEHVDRLEKLLEKMDEMTSVDTTAAIAERIHFVRIRFASLAGEGVARAHRPRAAHEWLLPVVDLKLEPGRRSRSRRSRYPGGTAS